MNKYFIITPSHFFKLDKNPQWIWHDLFGDQTKKEPLSEFALKIMEDGNIHEKEYISTLQVIEVKELDPAEGVEKTLSLMKEGHPLIYQGWLEKRIDNVIYRGRPDLLEKRSGHSIFGDWIYVPIDVKSSSEVKKLHKQQLAFYSMMLSSIQGYFPHETSIINRNFEKLDVLIDEKIINKNQEDIEKILSIYQGEKPTVHISSAAKKSPWYKECLREAEEQNDISLIYNLRKNTAESLRKNGIDTVKKLAELEIADLPKISGASLDTLQKAKIQAQSLVENKPFFIGSSELIPQSNLKLYFDIEGVEWLDTEYLFGFWVVGDPEGKYARNGHVIWSKEETGKYFLYFLAKIPELESVMWNNFLDWLIYLPSDYKVYHYTNYEKKALMKLSKKHRNSKELDQFQDNLVDLENCRKNIVILPLYFYSIKDIAKSPFLNFRWRHAKAGGEQSVFWYEQWLETKNSEILKDIVNYNEDDVRATEHLHLWLNKAPRSNNSTPLTLLTMTSPLNLKSIEKLYQKV